MFDKVLQFMHVFKNISDDITYTGWPSFLVEQIRAKTHHFSEKSQ